MATFTELLNDVYTLTNRPDLVGETTLAVKAATLKAHQIDYFYKDIEEVGMSFPLSEYIQSIEYRTVLPLYRALKYIRKTDAEGKPGPLLKLITPAEFLDRYNYERVDVCYVAGESIQIKSSTELQYILFGCYLNPNVSEANYNSWIALDHPYAIVYEAAATVFKMIGQDEQSTMFKKLTDEQFQFLRQSNIQAEGF
jgi:hypothetical protein